MLFSFGRFWVSSQLLFGSALPTHRVSTGTQPNSVPPTMRKTPRWQFYWGMDRGQTPESSTISPNSYYMSMSLEILKWWYPQIIHFNRIFHYFHHPFWGFYPYFRKHCYVLRWEPEPKKKLGETSAFGCWLAQFEKVKSRTTQPSFATIASWGLGVDARNIYIYILAHLRWSPYSLNAP